MFTQEEIDSFLGSLEGGKDCGVSSAVLCCAKKLLGKSFSEVVDRDNATYMVWLYSALDRMFAPVIREIEGLVDNEDFTLVELEEGVVLYLDWKSGAYMASSLSEVFKGFLNGKEMDIRNYGFQLTKREFRRKFRGRKSNGYDL